MKHGCEGIVGGVVKRPCMSTGRFEYNGHWYCKKHHRPSIDAYDRQRNAKWEDKWAEQDKQRKAANRQQELKDRAWEWMRRENPLVVKEWEEEL